MSTRWFIIAIGLLVPVSAVIAQPAVPGFARFHANAKDGLTGGGHLLLGELNCISCHAPAGTDLTVRTAPILDNIGGRVKRGYLLKFLADPHAVKPGTTMPNLFAGMDADEKKAKVEALAHFLASTGSPAQARPDRKGLSPGGDLYAKVGCVTCHGTRDVKGDQAKLFAGSIPLGNLKTKYTLASLKAFLENPHQTRPSGRMPGLLTPKEASDVANYLMQGTDPAAVGNNMKYAYYEGAWKSVPDFAKLKPKTSGDAADFELSVAKRTNNCALRFEGFLRIEKAGDYTFHTHSDDGSKLWIDDKVVVNNDGVHPPQSKSGKTKLTAGTHKVVVGVFNAGGGFELSVDFEGPGIGKQPLGPRIELSETPTKPVVVSADDFAIKPELVATGKELFTSIGCVNCHQMKGEKAKSVAPALAKMKSDGGCLDKLPKKGLPAYGLSGDQHAALRAGIQASEPAKLEPAQVVFRTMVAFNCYACHERGKIGGVEEEINKYFQTEKAEWGDEARIPPPLNGVGAKINPKYLRKILDEGSHDRPYMYTRMPKFGDPNVGHLVKLYADLDPAEKSPKVAPIEPLTKATAAARTMVGSKGGFNCVECHTFAGNKAGGMQGIDLTILTARLNKDWFHNYMVNPSKYRPGTRMPSSFSEPKSILKSILDGQSATQIEAMWVYLAQGKAATPPFGINKQSIPLVPTTEAIIYRNFIQGAGPRAIAVGYPERAHLAFDANDCRLAMIWQGGFIDAKRHWTDRGVGFEPPMGDNILNLPGSATLYILSKPDEAWPSGPAKALGYKFLGYRLTDDQRPTFLYSFNEIKIEDAPNAVEVKGNPTIRRVFTITTENPIDKLYYRALVGDKIVPLEDGWYRVNDLRVRIEASAAPVVRSVGGKMELLVPIQFKGNSSKVVQEYVW